MSTAMLGLNEGAGVSASPRRDFEAIAWQATRWLTVLIGFSIPVSTSLSEIATSLFLVFWFAGDWRGRCRTLTHNPVARLSLVLFMVLLAGTTWSSATWVEAFRCLLKYRELIYLPLLIPVFQDPQLKMLGMRGFALGALGMLGLSYFEWLSGTDVGIASSPNDYVIGKDRIIHSLLLALLAYFAAQELARGAAHRWWHVLVIALAVPNILFMVQGRTGYLLLGLLTILCLAQQFGRRGMIVACLLVGSVACGAYAVSETVQARVAQTILQLQNKFGMTTEKVWDPRLEYYTYTAQLIARHPLLGTGTGSFSREYLPLVLAHNLATSTDPHNEYLHLAVQGGIPTAGLFIALLALQWRCAGRLPEWESRIGRGLVLAIAVGSLFNSLILSVTGGLVWSYFSAIAFAGLSSARTSGEISPSTSEAALADQSPRVAA
ncbi:MAG: O-antigen ligase family protein [Planctomycetales bacterium]